MKNIGNEIRKKRMELKLKVYELANAIGVNPVYITQIEKHNKLPSINTFGMIVKFLKLNTDIYDDYFQQKIPALFDEKHKKARSVIQSSIENNPGTFDFDKFATSILEHKKEIKVAELDKKIKALQAKREEILKESKKKRTKSTS